MMHAVSIVIKGRVVMITLLACSLISLARTIERIMFWTKLKSKDSLPQILSLVENHEFEKALKLGKASNPPVGRVLAAGIAHRNPAPAKAMTAAAQAEIPVIKSRLGDVRYSVPALGNTTYDQFCKCGRDLDDPLERLGATRFYPRVDCDVDYDAPAGRSMTGVINSIRHDHQLKSAE